MEVRKRVAVAVTTGRDSFTAGTEGYASYCCSTGLCIQLRGPPIGTAHAIAIVGTEGHAS